MSNRPTTPHPAMAYALAADPDTRAEILDQLSVHRDPLIRHLVGRHPQLSAHTLRLLAHDRAPLVHRALVERPRLPADILTTLVQTYTTRPRRAQAATEILTRLGGHRVTPRHALIRLYTLGRRHPYPRLLEALARNPNTPPTILTQLGHTPTPELSTALIQNPATPGPLRLHLQLTTPSAEV